MQENKNRNKNKKTFIGKVVSDKMDKTIVVKVERTVKHPIYKKYIKKSRKIKAHDKNNQAKIGMKVKIIECRPLSKEKNFRTLKIIDKE